MSKLTLSIDPAVVAGAKCYADRHGISVSKLVQAYLSGLAGCDLVVTRDPRGFPRSPVLVLPPETAAAFLKGRGSTGPQRLP